MYSSFCLASEATRFMLAAIVIDTNIQSYVRVISTRNAVALVSLQRPMRSKDKASLLYTFGGLGSRLKSCAALSPIIVQSKHSLSREKPKESSTYSSYRVHMEKPYEVRTGKNNLTTDITA